MAEPQSGGDGDGDGGFAERVARATAGADKGDGHPPLERPLRRATDCTTPPSGPVAGAATVEDAAKRWLACPECGNQIGNCKYNDSDRSDPRNPIIIGMCECGKCAHRWATGEGSNELRWKQTGRGGLQHPMA